MTVAALFTAIIDAGAAKKREYARSGTSRCTVLEPPRLPFMPEARKTILMTTVGATGGTIVGVFLAFFAAAVRKASPGWVRMPRSSLSSLRP